MSIRTKLTPYYYVLTILTSKEKQIINYKFLLNIRHNITLQNMFGRSLCATGRRSAENRRGRAAEEREIVLGRNAVRAARIPADPGRTGRRVVPVGVRLDGWREVGGATTAPRRRAVRRDFGGGRERGHVRRTGRRPRVRAGRVPRDRETVRAHGRFGRDHAPRVRRGQRPWPRGRRRGVGGVVAATASIVDRRIRRRVLDNGTLRERDHDERYRTYYRTQSSPYTIRGERVVNDNCCDF